MPFGIGRKGGRGRHGRGGMGGAGGRGSFVAGDCLCPRCGAVLPYRLGVPCFQIACPSCGSPMTRRFNVPGEGTSRRTAAAPSEKPVVDQDACTGCQSCVPVCPENAIEMRDDKAFIMADPCANCRACIPACPVGAIK